MSKTGEKKLGVVVQSAVRPLTNHNEHQSEAPPTVLVLESDARPVPCQASRGFCIGTNYFVCILQKASVCHL